MNQLLVVLDLDETLVYASDIELAHPHDFRTTYYWVYKRPYLDSFLESLFARFHVAIWTAANPAYLDEILPRLASLHRFQFVWNGLHCTRRLDRDTRDEYTIKNLRKLRSRGIPLERTVVVDDSPEKHERNYGNLVHVPAFEGDPSDAVLPKLACYLEHLSAATNVRAVDKRNWLSWRPDAV